MLYTRLVFVQVLIYIPPANLQDNILIRIIQH